MSTSHHYPHNMILIIMKCGVWWRIDGRSKREFMAAAVHQNIASGKEDNSGGSSMVEYTALVDVVKSDAPVFFATSIVAAPSTTLPTTRSRTGVFNTQCRSRRVGENMLTKGDERNSRRASVIAVS
ncbi:hypothetical protein QCA50_007105 [Cerrena zonata]|uniref:Uncharacterized protein n=1 Tax=Cerrena zonata TaxID=2478898 RepID=A0AAW0GD94_9APHY